MKIHFINSDLKAGGAQRVMVILANHFAHIDHDVSIITFNPGLAYELKDKVQLIKLHQGKFPNIKIRSLINLIKYYRKKEHRPDVIISFVTLNNLLSIIVAKVYGIKIIVSEHNNKLRKQSPKILTDITRYFFYRLADYVTILTGDDLDYYKKMGCNTVIMPNPCSFELVEEVNQNKEKMIVAVGDLNRYEIKGFDSLIKIVAPILKEDSSWNVKIVGSGDDGLKILKEMAREYDIENRIIFTGFRTDVSDILRDSEIFILPSRIEGLPMVLLEAMSQGTATIAFDCKTGPRDIIVPDVNGKLIEDQNYEAMRKELRTLMYDDELRARLAKKALKGMDKYSIEHISDKWHKLFNQLVK